MLPICQVREVGEIVAGYHSLNGHQDGQPDDDGDWPIG